MTSGKAVSAADKSSRSDWKAAQRRRQQESRAPAGITKDDTISCGGCWCGEPFGHDWPGKAEGAVHPKVVRRN